jgi:hypothetical protein
MNDWNTLLQAALVGTERPWSLPTLAQEGEPDTVARMLREAHAQATPDAPGLLLRLAGAKAVCQRAGWTAPATALNPIAPAAPESRTLANAAWSQLLSQAVNLGPQRLQHQVLFAMDAAALRAPPALLPALLHAGRQSVALRTHLLPVLGERGRWLAQQNAEWAYACGAQEQADTQTHWAHGSLEQRCAVLRTERTTAPAAARERLQADWENLAAKDRAALIATLHVGLCADDEAFLTLQLKDRAIDVRRTAADLLAALPSSAYSQRMVARMQALVASEQAEPGLVGRLLGKVLSSAEPRWTVQAPDQAEADWKTDLLELERPKHDSLGERAWWLYQLTSRTPLAWWTAHTALAPAELLKLAQRSDWTESLVRGWTDAVLWQLDAAWAQALLDHAGDLHGDHRAELLAMLPASQREAFLLQQLGEPKQLYEVVAACLAGCVLHATLGQAVSMRLAQLLRQQIDRGALQDNYSLRSLLPDVVCVLHPGTAHPLANLPRSAEETTSLSEALTLLEQVIHSRQQLIQLTQEKSTP